MKNFKLQENEELLAIENDINVIADDNHFTLTLFLTTDRLVLFKDVNQELEYNAFLKSRVAYIPPNNEVVFNLALAEIKEITYKNNINVITFKNNNHKLSLYCENLNKYLN